MPRLRHFLDQDVLTAARQRINHVYDTFDSVVVMFSGGKDSLVTLHLVQEVATERGALPVQVVFRDEELIPNSVIDFVAGYRGLPWINLRWYCLPLINTKFILARKTIYRAWDPARKWVRDMPGWGIKAIECPWFNDADQHGLDAGLAQDYPGKVAFLLGIRADESLTRYRSVVNKLNENYICTPIGCASRKVKLVKPIYDWRENDIFKFFMEQNIRYCPLYDSQNVCGSNLRVATPLHAESAKRFDLLRSMDPDFYQRLIDVFPDMTVQERYWHDYDPDLALADYLGKGWAGIAAYIEEQVEDPWNKEQALARLAEYRGLAIRQPESYTPDHLLRAITNGAIFRTVMPVGTRTKERLRKKG